MSDTVIKVENLSKQYRIGSAVDRHQTFREAMTDTFTYPFRRLKHAFSRGNATSDKNPEYIWALKDVSFEVKQGEVVGIIGRNGAGKSTLLKILARITEPTEGRATLRGRVGSLLEVGTGFHSELTGEENIYLSGTILGMRSDEISRKFDEIVAFAEMEKFINTPVKYYSSGMYMRLAFAVAAHLEPEILLVDEVLAVGDAIFQTKCLAQMSKITQEGRTVLYISHNMSAIGSVCRRCIVLDKGRLEYDGGTFDAIHFYEESILHQRYFHKNVSERKDRRGTGEVKLVSFHVENDAEERIEHIPNGQTVRFVFGYETAVQHEVENVEINFVVNSQNGDRVFQFGTRFTGENFAKLPSKGFMVGTIERFPLVPGRYTLDVYLVAGSKPSDYIRELAFFDVVDGDFYGSAYQVFENESRFLVGGAWTCRPLN